MESGLEQNTPTFLNTFEKVEKFYVIIKDIKRNYFKKDLFYKFKKKIKLVA
jgi:hypothetical protein